ncbi:MAG TPA: anthranilate phosphoribosyltransferase, partial [Rhodospirillaceae bacterium]|nr:anthranilate phosphoribosyltransferase [Rhodospirillaceae bacterium]
AAALVLSGRAADLGAGVAMAREALETGAAKRVLEAYRALTQGGG